MATTTTKLITYEEWLRMPEVEDQIEEVVDGEIRLMPPNQYPHVNATDNLRYLLEQKLDRKMVRVLDTNMGLVIRKSPLTSRVPDLAIFIRKNMIVADGYFHSAPELAVEVLSPSNTRAEMRRKLLDYGSIGVPEVWIVSPEGQTVEVLQLEAGVLKTVRILSSGPLAPKLFPDATIEAAEIWED